MDQSGDWRGMTKESQSTVRMEGRLYDDAVSYDLDTHFANYVSSLHKQSFLDQSSAGMAWTNQVTEGCYLKDCL